MPGGALWSVCLHQDGAASLCAVPPTSNASDSSAFLRFTNTERVPHTQGPLHVQRTVTAPLPGRGYVPVTLGTPDTAGRRSLVLNTRCASSSARFSFAYRRSDSCGGSGPKGFFVAFVRPCDDGSRNGAKSNHGQCQLYTINVARSNENTAAETASAGIVRPTPLLAIPVSDTTSCLGSALVIEPIDLRCGVSLCNMPFAVSGCETEPSQSCCKRE